MKKFRTFLAAAAAAALTLGMGSAQAATVTGGDTNYKVSAASILTDGSWTTLTPIDLGFGTTEFGMAGVNEFFANQVADPVAGEMMLRFGAGQLAGATLVAPNTSFQGIPITASISGDTVHFLFAGANQYFSTFTWRLFADTPNAYFSGPVTGQFRLQFVNGVTIPNSGVGLPYTFSRDDTVTVAIPAPSVPEPSIFALTLAGLAVVGYMTRRRSRRRSR